MTMDRGLLNRNRYVTATVLDSMDLDRASEKKDPKPVTRYTHRRLNSRTQVPNRRIGKADQSMNKFEPCPTRIAAFTEVAIKSVILMRSLLRLNGSGRDVTFVCSARRALSIAAAESHPLLERPFSRGC